MRTLFVCPTLMINPWGTQGWIMREPHGRNPGIAYWTGAPATNYMPYDRNCAFNDGHVESRTRSGGPVAAQADLPCPWMEGSYSYNNSTTQDPGF